MMAEPDDPAYILVGRIGAPYGVRGWVKVHSFTESPQNILDYEPWYLRTAGKADAPWRVAAIEDAKDHGKGIVAKFAGCDDRDAAALSAGTDIAIHRDQLPPAEEGEYYWVDLVGLKVLTLEGADLGRVDHLMETGANDVLVVVGERERLIPFVMGVIVKDVNIEAGLIRVDWDADF